MNRFVRLCALVLAMLSALAICTAASFYAHAAPEGPAISAKACVLMDAQTGQVIYALNAEEKRPMASTTKIMTTLLTLESGDLDTPFTVDPEAIQVEGSSMGLQPGDTVTKRALCVGMLLPSGNDAANASAVAVAGNIPDFLDMMNARAKKIGMTRSCFASPSGLDAEGHGASAHDMALLAREALKNPDFAEICRQPRMTVCFGNPPYARTLKNTNKLLTMDSSILGVKTGFTDAAGRCLVSACEREGRRLICVTLFDRDDWNDHLKLYDYGFSLASDYTVSPPRTLTVPAEGGELKEIPVYVREPLTVTAWRGIPPEPEVTVLLPPFLTAPVEKGTPVGKLVYRTDCGCIAELPLYTAQALVCKTHEKTGSGLLIWLKKLFCGDKTAE